MSLDRKTLDDLRERIESELQRLDSIVATGQAASEIVELDQSRVGRLSRMDALQTQAMSKATSQRNEQQIRRLSAALQRLNLPEFGLCLDCDEPIALKRLHYDPSARLCINCQSERDSQ